ALPSVLRHHAGRLFLHACVHCTARGLCARSRRGGSMIDKIANDVVNVLLAPVDLLFVNVDIEEDVGLADYIEDVLEPSGKNIGFVEDRFLKEVVDEISAGDTSLHE